MAAKISMGQALVLALSTLQPASPDPAAPVLLVGVQQMWECGLGVEDQGRASPQSGAVAVVAVAPWVLKMRAKAGGSGRYCCTR
jgi:hypothetical protein